MLVLVLVLALAVALAHQAQLERWAVHHAAALGAPRGSRLAATAPAWRVKNAHN